MFHKSTAVHAYEYLYNRIGIITKVSWPYFINVVLNIIFYTGFFIAMRKRITRSQECGAYGDLWDGNHPTLPPKMHYGDTSNSRIPRDSAHTSSSEVYSKCRVNKKVVYLIPFNLWSRISAIILPSSHISFLKHNVRKILSKPTFDDVWGWIANFMDLGVD